VEVVVVEEEETLKMKKDRNCWEDKDSFLETF